MKPLTQAQRRALTLAANPGGAVINEDRFAASERLHVRVDMAERLVLNGWATIRTEDDAATRMLLVTDAGRSKLAAPIPATPRFLNRNPASPHAYTTIPALGVAGEPEAVDAVTLEKITERKLLTADQRRVAALAELQQQQAALLKGYEALGSDDKRVQDRVRLIRRSMKAIDQIVRRAA